MPKGNVEHVIEETNSIQKFPRKLGGKLELKKKLGAGCFGEVYSGVNLETHDEVAIKLEDAQKGSTQLPLEVQVLIAVRGTCQPQGFAKFYWSGREDTYNFLVMELLGKSIDDKLLICGGKFNVGTTALIAEQVFCRLEHLHSKGFVHRDIKPENFAFGTDAKAHHIYLIDFGLSKKYWEHGGGLTRGKHIVQRGKGKQGQLTGTVRYASIHAHTGGEQSRRDDLEATSHMLLYFLRGSLPWSGMEARTKVEKYNKIMQKKQEVPVEDLCASHPEEFEQLLKYTRNLGFSECPDYEHIQTLMRAVREKEGVKHDYEFQWFDSQELPMPAESLKELIPHSRLDQPDDPPKRAARIPGEKRRLLKQMFCGMRKEKSSTSVPKKQLVPLLLMAH